MPPWAAWCVVAMACLATASTLASAADVAPEARVAVLAYHPFPDAEAAAGLGGDPFGVEAFHRAPKDRMAGYYGAVWFPTTWFDGVRVSSFEQGASAPTAASLTAEYGEHVAARLSEDPAFAVRVASNVTNATVTVEASFTPNTRIASERVALRLVVFEDHVDHDGGNGVLDHRFVVRKNLPVAFVTSGFAGPVNVTRSFNVSTEWDVTRLGVVAFAQNEDPQSPTWVTSEVLAAASHRLDAPVTVATERFVLLEVYTAVWCAPCVASDAAVTALVTAAADLEEASRFTYFTVPSGGRILLALAAAGVFALVLWPRDRPGGAP